MMEDTYTVEVECQNCERIGSVSILKGSLVPDVMECPNCGCKTAYRKAKPQVGVYPRKRFIPWEPLPYSRPHYPFDVYCLYPK